MGTARHRGRLAWDDPLLIDRPVLPLARSTSHPSEQAPAGEPVFGLVSTASRLDIPRMPPISAVARIHLRRLLAASAPVSPRSPPPPASPSLPPCGLGSSWPCEPSPPDSAVARFGPSAPTHIDIPSSAGLAALDSGLPSTFGLRRPSELWFIPRLVVLSDPDQARPLACAFVLPRWARSSCDPVCHHHAGDKIPGQGVFFQSQGYPPRFRTIPRTILFIHR